MPIVDERGRLLGRVNLVDAMVAVVVAGLIPLGYAAYVLFRTPEPRLVGVEPAATISVPGLRVKIRGEHLRPPYRVSFGTYQGRTFVFKSETEAEVDLDEMPPGVYDVVLYDFAQERSRLTQAFTINPSPLPDTRLIVVGSFGGLTAAEAKQLQPGTPVIGSGEVLQVAEGLPDTTRVIAGVGTVEVSSAGTLRVPAVVRFNCFVRTPAGRPECVGAGQALHPTSVLTLPTPLGPRAFQVDQVRSVEPLESVRVMARLSGPNAAAAAVRPGDIDVGVAMNPLAAGARILAAAPSRPASPDTSERVITLSVPAQRSTSGWVYASTPLRIGASFLFKTLRYELTGVVVDVDDSRVAKP